VEGRRILTSSGLRLACSTIASSRSRDRPSRSRPGHVRAHAVEDFRDHDRPVYFSDDAGDRDVLAMLLGRVRLSRTAVPGRARSAAGGPLGPGFGGTQGFSPAGGDCVLRPVGPGTVGGRRGGFAEYREGATCVQSTVKNRWK
jgi:hypothetical protein